MSQFNSWDEFLTAYNAMPADQKSRVLSTLTPHQNAHFQDLLAVQSTPPPPSFHQVMPSVDPNHQVQTQAPNYPAASFNGLEQRPLPPASTHPTPDKGIPSPHAEAPVGFEVPSNLDHRQHQASQPPHGTQVPPSLGPQNLFHQPSTQIPLPSPQHGNESQQAKIEKLVSEDLALGKSLVLKFSIACAFIGLIPFSSLALIPVEIALAYQLSRIYQVQFGIGEFSKAVAALWLLSNIFFAFVGGFLSVIPAVGWVLKASIAFCFVMLFGHLINKYYSIEKTKRLSAMCMPKVLQ